MKGRQGAVKRKQAMKNRHTDQAIKAILARQFAISGVFLLLLFLPGSRIHPLLGIVYALLECVLFAGGFCWLSFQVNRAMRGIDDTIGDLIDGKEILPDENLAFSMEEDTLTGKFQMQILKLYDIIKSQEERERELRNRLSGLVADLVHQINTPLTNIKMYCGFLSLEDLGAEDRTRFVGNISMAAEKLEWFGEGFSKVARLETDMMALKPVPQQLLPIVLKAIGQAALKAEAKNNEIRLEGDRGAMAWADGKWTGEALFNLLDNAVKYGDEGECILVRLCSYDLYACIEVCNEGNRIPPAERNDVFKRFYRGKTAALNQEGVGLGLFLARKVAGGQGGYMMIEDYGKHGNCFRLFIRRAEGVSDT